MKNEQTIEFNVLKLKHEFLCTDYDKLKTDYNNLKVKKFLKFFWCFKLALRYHSSATQKTKFIALRNHSGATHKTNFIANVSPVKIN